MTDGDLQHQHCGAAAAKDCPWFTDNSPLLELFYNRSSWQPELCAHAHRSPQEEGCPAPFVVRIETGVFRGA